MAQACTTCGGVGRGSIDEEFGWRRGNKTGQPEPCPDCQARLTKRAKKEGLPADIEPGPYIDPQAKVDRRKTVAVVDGDTYSDQEFDPGFVNTGRETVSLDDAPAMAGAGEE